MAVQNPGQAVRLHTYLARGALIVSSVILALTVAAYVAAPLLAWSWVRLPFPGFTLEPTLVVAGTFDPHWHGMQAGLKQPYCLAAVDDQPVRGTSGLNDVLRGYRVGDTATFDFVDPTSGQRAQFPLELVPFSGRDIVSFFLIPYLVGLSYLVIGVWVFRLRYRQAVGRVFVLMCCGVAVMTGLIFDTITTHMLVWLWVGSIPLAGGAMIGLSLLFPQEQRLAARSQALRWLPYLPTLALFLTNLSFVYDMADPLGYIPPWRYGYYYGGLGLLAFIGMVAYRRFFSSSPIVRRQSNVILWGAFLAFIPMGVYIVRTLLGLTTVFIPWVYMLSLVLFPIAIALSILRYRALDIDMVVSRGVSYALLTGIIVGVYFLMINAVSLLLRSTVEAYTPWLIAALVLVVAVLLDPARDRIQRAVDTVFQRGKVDYRTSLQAYSERLTEQVDVEHMLGSLCAEIEHALHPNVLYVYLHNPQVAGYLASTLPGMSRPAPGVVRFPADSPLAALLAESRVPLYIEAERPLPPGLEAELERLNVLGASLFVPLRSSRRSGSGRALDGWIALSDRQSGQRYTNDDLDFLLSLADQTTLALEKARIFVDLNRRVEELSVLSLISQAVTFSLRVDDVFELVYAQCSKIIDTSNFYIALYDDRSQMMRMAFYVEQGERLYLEDAWGMDVGLSGEIIRTGHPILTNDYLAECERRGMTPGVNPGRAWVGLPLLSGDRVFGVMSMSSFDPDVVYTEENLQFLRAVADQTASILEKNRLYREMEQRALQLVTLNEVGRTIASTLDMRAALNLVIEKAAEILDAEAASLFLVDQETGELIFEVALGPTAPNLLGTRLPKGQGIVGTVAQTLEPTIVNDAASDKRHYKGYDQDGAFTTQSIIAVPMIYKDAAIGVIEVLNKRDGRPFDKDDQNLLQAFAAQSAVAIENARLFTMTDAALATRVEELQTLQRIDRELNAALDVERALDLTVEWAMRITGATSGLLGIVTPEGDGLLLRAIRGYDEELERYRTEPWPIERGIMGRVARLGFPNMVADVGEDDDYVELVEGIKSQLTVPVPREHRVIGVITLESDKLSHFDLEDLNFVVRLADHASVAISNSQLYEQVKLANEYKSEFVSMVAHELKLPMQNIKGYGDLLAKGLGGELSEMQNQFVSVIRSNVDRMNTLVSDLLDISRIETGRLRLDLKPTAMQEVVDEAVGSLKQRIEEKKQTITVEAPDQLPQVLGDKGRLTQITINMVSNAHKYTPEGGHILVRLWQEACDGRTDVVCSVKDNGVGIAPEDVARLGQKFFRVDNPAVQDVHGHGLGLSIVKNLIQMHGGELTVESELGQGSTFSFNVPVAE
jgi:signal transduction histidine kinase